jgi:hypothetical protein
MRQNRPSIGERGGLGGGFQSNTALPTGRSCAVLDWFISGPVGAVGRLIVDNSVPGSSKRFQYVAVAKYSTRSN